MKRDNFVWGFTPFKSRYNPGIFLFECKNCKHEYLKDVSPFTVKDIALKSSEHYKTFWAQKFKCPECKLYTSPVILVFDPNPGELTKPIL